MDFQTQDLINNTMDSQEEIIEAQDNQEVFECTVEELLIQCVQARPPLWDSRIPLKERSRPLRDQLWLEIYQEFEENPEFTIEALQKKWRNLRDSFMRLKGTYVPSGSGSEGAKKKKWLYYDAMAFLNDTINYRPTVTNISLATPSTSSTPTPSSTPGILSPELLDSAEPAQIKKGGKVEGAILDALSRVNAPILEQIHERKTNAICERISELLDQMPQKERTLLEIQLLQVAYEGASKYLK